MIWQNYIFYLSVCCLSPWYCVSCTKEGILSLLLSDGHLIFVECKTTKLSIQKLFWSSYTWFSLCWHYWSWTNLFLVCFLYPSTPSSPVVLYLLLFQEFFSSFSHLWTSFHGLGFQSSSIINKSHYVKGTLLGSMVRKVRKCGVPWNLKVHFLPWRIHLL